jgi:phosphatidylinositol alpha-1,6-mannosyltransferase
VIRVLPHIFREHPEAIYLVVGDGDDRSRLQALAVECGVADKVTFVGRVEADELPDYYRLADVFVMPSTGEGFGIVFLEAMACGVPVIGGNKDGSIDPLADGAAGTAIDPDNSAALASAICSALRSPPSVLARPNRFGETAFRSHLNELVACLDYRR